MTSFRFDGRDIVFSSGQTVGAALISAGIMSWRTTRLREAPRGIFCGIGVCYDCLITVDGLANQRACVLPARDGAVARTQHGTGRDDLAR